MDWDEYFKMMRKWKQLPSYKAEPRIDSMVGFYLGAYLEYSFKKGIDGIIPEFPLRRGTLFGETVSSGNKSKKVDFYARGTDGSNYFIEFKTDMASRNITQDKYLEKAAGKGMKSIVKGIARITMASNYKDKYQYLNRYMQRLGMIDEEGNYVGEEKISIIYFQPAIDRNDSENLRHIGFSDFAEWLKEEHPTGDFEQAFASLLIDWSKD